ncbi:MAG: dehydrogenase, partial [Bacteroidaceae bacterium]|nr:dehydrogenase [Bacteroidaceae bacterium]
MDIEDAHKLRLLTTEETKKLFFLFLDEKKQARAQEVFEIVTDINEQIAYLRSTIVGLLIGECTRAFMEHEEEILAGTFTGTLIKSMSLPVREAYEMCARTALSRIYRSKEVLDVELAGYKVISTLLNLMMEAVTSPEKTYSKLLIDRVSEQYDMNSPTLYGKIQAVLDYVSGMTDVFALDLYRKINGGDLPAV